MGISRDTLKFYEKKGLIRPMKDDGNGYRKYNDYDICDAITTNFYRQLDIEIKKIQAIRDNKSVLEKEHYYEPLGKIFINVLSIKTAGCQDEVNLIINRGGLT